jgi:hypothetical protein
MGSNREWDSSIMKDIKLIVDVSECMFRALKTAVEMVSATPPMASVYVKTTLAFN